MTNTLDRDIGSLAEAVADVLRDKPTDTAYVVYAGDLTESIRENIESGIRREFPEVEGIEYAQDDSIIAGFKVTYKDYIIDASVHGQLSTSRI